MIETFAYLGAADRASNRSELNAHAFLVNQMINRIATAVPVKVMAVSVPADELAAVGTVDVQPLVNQLDGYGNATPHGTIYAIPYLRMQGGANAIVIDPQVDDIGLATFASHDISSVKANKAQANPGSARRFDWADGIYHPAMLNGVPEQYVQFKSTGIKFADKNGNVVETMPGSIAITGNVTVTGTLTAGFGTGDAVMLQAHTHGGGPPPDPGT